MNPKDNPKQGGCPMNAMIDGKVFYCRGTEATPSKEGAEAKDAPSRKLMTHFGNAEEQRESANSAPSQTSCVLTDAEIEEIKDRIIDVRLNGECTKEMDIALDDAVVFTNLKMLEKCKAEMDVLRKGASANGIFVLRQRIQELEQERERMLSDEKIWKVITGIEYPRAREVMTDGKWATHYHVLDEWRTKEEAIQAVKEILKGE